MAKEKICLKNVRVHNLQGIDLELPVNQFIVFTGVSGSGKSSLAFDTLYVEGQRRYVESLSNYAKRQMGQLSKPDAEHLSGVSPTISIEQKTVGRNPRSTVGTLTEIYDYLRVLYARVGRPHCPISGEPVSPQSKERIIKSVQLRPEGSKLIILAPYAQGKKGEFKDDFQELLKKGFMRVRVDGEIYTLDQEIALDGNVAHDVEVVIDRVAVKPSENSRIAESLTTALEMGQGLCMVLDAASEATTLYSMHAYSPKSGESYSSLEPHDFSFNAPAGMCEECHGMGEVQNFDIELIIDPDKSIADNCCSVASGYETVRYGNIYDNLARLYHFDVHTPWKKLPAKAQKVFLYGTEKKWTRMIFTHPVRNTQWVDHVQWRGALYEAHKRYQDAKSKSYRTRMEKLMKQQQCPHCEGARLKPYPAATLFADKKIQEVTRLTVQEAYDFFSTVELDGDEALIAEELLKEIRQRLLFLLDVGLDYLSLDRTAPTLSGGEAQRVRLASQIGCGLVGVTYILDEPSIGLHPRDNKKLISTLHSLRDKGNTVLVVEHDEETVRAADYVVDFGPGAGHKGGHVVVQGSLKKLLSSKKSVTGAYLSGRRVIDIPEQRRKPGKAKLKLSGATHHNLKKLSVKIPLGCLVAVTGVSGSGKSSLVSDILYPAIANELLRADMKVGAHKKLEGLDAIDKVISIDQSPIGRSPRSNPSTYTKLFDEIRDLFTKLPESQARGYKAGRFSFNVREGSCTHCSGMGAVKVDMDFMEAAWVDCPVCRTRRFDEETLTVRYKGKNIYDVLDMEVEDALRFFENIPSLKRKLEMLEAVGLGYMRLGQPSTTLSGGEAQRIKLAKELMRPSTGQTLYILDEPTTGLHFHDISHLLKVLHTLVDRGNSVLVIEHNMDVVKTADWIIDLGPEGGDGGGRLVAEGTPEKISQLDSPTGHAVHEALHPTHELPTSTKQTKGKQQVKNITVEAATQNNLKHVDITIPRGKMTVCTGPSGSGKSSLAIDTIYAEGQRRYIESLSPYARQFVKQMPKPRVGQVEGLSPAICIEQKTHAGNPRSTVGTMTEAYDFLRILYARAGQAYCPDTGEPIRAISKDHVVDRILALPEGEKLQILAPIEVKKGEKFTDITSRLQRQGYLRIRLNGEIKRLDEDLSFDRRKKNSVELIIDRLKASPSNRMRVYEAVESAAQVGNDSFILLREDATEILFNLAFCVESTGKSYPEITPQSFAFNTPEGMCPECQGLGVQYGANIAEHPQLRNMRVCDLFYHMWLVLDYRKLVPLVDAVLNDANIVEYDAIHELNTKQKNILLNGSPTIHTLPSGLEVRWIGINNVLARIGKSGSSSLREAVIPLLEEYPCPACEGTRLTPLARNVRLDGLSLGELCALPLAEARAFINTLKLDSSDEKLLEEVLTQLRGRLNFLCEVGLHYMAMDRKARTLSGGETQRIRLARQLGTALTGVLYVLDEPTIGLHPRDNDLLHRALAKLKDLGNTLLLVEHDPMTIRHADYLLDFGPGAGTHGGHVTAKGTLKQILRDKRSLTGAYLSGRKSIPARRAKARPEEGAILVRDVSIHNLKELSVDVPLEQMTGLTGVSGSGKSTLMHQVIRFAVERGLKHSKDYAVAGGTVRGIDEFDKLIVIDQNPIGTTNRATVATYTDLLKPLREFFAALPEAQIRGLQPKHFSTNHRKGMCTHCWGMGHKRIEMHFLPPVRVTCPECKGLRLNPLSLEVEYKGHNLGQYLYRSIEEISEIFGMIPRVKRLCNTLMSVGLGYLTLNQQMQTLSGGEGQRLKLARELTKRSTGNTLYLLDEPTTGLHSDDVAKLLNVLNKIVDKGNTVLIIEHNLDVLRACDHLIELGPEAGAAGGEVVCTGTPEELMAHKQSCTGPYLAQ